MIRYALSTLIALLLASAPPVGTAKSAPEDKFPFTIDNLMRGPNLIGTEPSQVRWSGDSTRLYFQWKRASDPENAPLDTYVVNRDGSGLRKSSDDEARLAPPFIADTNKDRTLSVFAQDGDLVTIDNATGKRRQVTKTEEPETNPHFTADGRHITFQRGTNLFLLSLDNGDLEQLTDIRPAPTPGAAPATPRQGRATTEDSTHKTGTDAQDKDKEKKDAGSQEYLKKEQADLFETVRDREKLQKENDEKKKKLNPRKPYTLQAQQTLIGLQLSPDGKYVFGILAQADPALKADNVPTWITDSSFPEELNGRPRVGDDLQQHHLLVINVVTGESKQVDHDQVKTPVAQIEDGGACGGRAGFGGFGGGGFGNQQTVNFSDDGSKAVFTARAQDNKTCWILGLDPATAKARVLFEDQDKAWLGGPGGGQGWLGDNDTYYFTSERDGFNHLYTISFEAAAPKQLTSGKYEDTRVELSHDKSRFYITSSEGDLAEQNLWSLPVAGGEPTRMTKATGMHQTILSPDEKWIADLYSYVNKPPELYVQPNQPEAEETRLTDSPAPEFAEHHWLDTPLIHVPARDGAQIPAHIYKPANFRKGGPAVIFVHGAGYLQNVTKGWSTSYSHEYLFNQFLMQRGYLVLALDYRGSKGYGRDWRTAIYRHMGGTDLDDQVDAAKWLVSKQGVDPKHIGMYGGSYGGFMTLMAMFTQPDVFAAGAALRPVSDWALYNQGYTGNILNQPQTDAEAYKQSSPILFANGLKGALLICHGMVDTNVHFVDTVRLVQRLIELHKENWQLAVYPVEDHSFKETSSWTDEYKRIFNLFEANLKNEHSEP